MLRFLRISVFFFLLTSVASATTIQGSLYGSDQHGKYAKKRVPVTLYSKSKGRSKASYTNSRGNFSMRNVPGGKYTLEIWNKRNKAIKRTITVPKSGTLQLKPYRVD